MIVVGHDSTHENIARLPGGQAAGYTTGTSGIRWTDADWKAHPGAVRICQDNGTDHTADVLDIERGAATLADAPAWVPKAQAAYQAATRPGQREPALYASASVITPLVNALIRAGIKRGVYLWVAHWGETNAQARAEVEAASGPFPIIGIQDRSEQFYDVDIFSHGWLSRVSAKPAPGGAPFRHLTKAGDTVALISASRGMRPDTWLTEQHQLGADVLGLASGPLGAGHTWLSVTQ